MEENLRFSMVLKNGTERSFNVQGAKNLIDAVFEVASSIMHGDTDYSADDIVQFTDIPG